MKAGLHHKYDVLKADGSPTDPKAQYYVLRTDTDPHARKALMAYAASVSVENPMFAVQLRQWVKNVVAALDARQ